MAVEPLPGELQGPIVRERLRVAWIVEETIGFYKKHFASLFSVFLVANLAVWMVQYYSGAQISSVLARHNVSISEIAEHPEDSASLPIGVLTDLFIVFLFMSVVVYLITLVLDAAAIRYVCERLRGGATDWMECFGEGIRTLPRLVGATVVAGLIVGLGLLAFVVPGLILMMMFILVPQAVVLEGHGPISALSRSNRLTSGNKMVIFMFFLFWVLVFLLVYMILGGIVGIIGGIAVSTLLAPVFPISTTVVYLRVSSQPS